MKLTTHLKESNLLIESSTFHGSMRRTKKACDDIYHWEFLSKYNFQGSNSKNIYALKGGYPKKRTKTYNEGGVRKRTMGEGALVIYRDNLMR